MRRADIDRYTIGCWDIRKLSTSGRRTSCGMRPQTVTDVPSWLRSISDPLPAVSSRIEAEPLMVRIEELSPHRVGGPICRSKHSAASWPRSICPCPQPRIGLRFAGQVERTKRPIPSSDLPQRFAREPPCGCPPTESGTLGSSLTEPCGIGFWGYLPAVATGCGSGKEEEQSSQDTSKFGAWVPCGLT
jgi:hypothetical protein